MMGLLVSMLWVIEVSSPSLLEAIGTICHLTDPMESQLSFQSYESPCGIGESGGNSLEMVFGVEERPVYSIFV